MGYYKRIIEQLNAEYCNRTSITLFGRQATMLRLFADSYEVRLRFEKLLEDLQQGPVLVDDADLNYLEWADEAKWKMLTSEKQETTASTAEVFGFSESSPFAQSYANRMKDAFGERLKNINLDRFSIIMSSVIVTSEAIPDYEFEVAIDENIRQLQKTLIEIYNFKSNKRWTNNDYDQVYQNLRSDFDDSPRWKLEVKRAHNKWLRGNYPEPDIDDYAQRRRELLLDLFRCGFLDALKYQRHVPARDDLNFECIKDEALIPNLTETLIWYAAFKKLCPLQEGTFSFNEYASLGRYIYDNNISKEICWEFFFLTSLIDIVQKEMGWLEHPDTKPQGEDETVTMFVERVKKIMLKAEDSNGALIEYEDSKHNKCTYEFNVDGRGFCAVMEQIKKEYPAQILDYLEKAKGENAIGVTKVCPFIGYVISLHLFNDELVRNKDFEPAFMFVYGEKNDQGKKRSYIQKMSATGDIKDKNVFKTIKTLYENQKK